MYKKIIIFSILAIFLMGFVSAQDFSDFKIGDGFKDVGDGVYVKYDSKGEAEESMAILNYTQHNGEDYFVNDTGYGYSVNKSKNNIYNYYDGKLKEQGSCEIVNKSGKLYIIESWESIDNAKDFNNTFNDILEFNKVNNLKPVDVSKVLK